jgi:hypothetical protein
LCSSWKSTSICSGSSNEISCSGQISSPPTVRGSALEPQPGTGAGEAGAAYSGMLTPETPALLLLLPL